MRKEILEEAYDVRIELVRAEGRAVPIVLAEQGEAESAEGGEGG